MAKRNVKKKNSKKTTRKLSPKHKKIIKNAIIVDNYKKSLAKKFNIVLTNLFIFALLFITSSLLYLVTNNDFYSVLFYLFSILFGFISIAFLIVLLIFIFINLNKKK